MAPEGGALRRGHAPTRARCCAAALLAGAAPAAALSLSDWFDPAKAPFLPIPELDVDPDTGTTFGLIPVQLRTDEAQVIRRVLAPDIIYNQYFGWGARARIFEYPSDDEQWSVIVGAKQRVERELHGLYEIGRQRRDPWSYQFEALDDRSGTPRFYGIGNDSRAIDVTDYTREQAFLRATETRNLTTHWQLSYTLRWRLVNISSGQLAKIASISTRFANVIGLGETHELLHRLSGVFDTRDDVLTPAHGTQVSVYVGLAARAGLLNDSLYDEAGIDVRQYWTVAPQTVLALHGSVRYMPDATHAPFWSLSSLGGDEAIVGEEQPLRGYGQYRFQDNNAYSANLELRRRVGGFNANGTAIDIELSPFIDAGRVFRRNTLAPPLGHLHDDVGVGVRMLARPTVVGYLDVGYGSDGAAVFTGINYPF